MDVLHCEPLLTWGGVNTTDELVVPEKSSVSIPLRTTSEINAGAVSLVLNYPAALTELTGVVSANASDLLTWAANNGELRISLCLEDGRNFKAGDVLLMLEVRLLNKSLPEDGDLQLVVDGTANIDNIEVVDNIVQNNFPAAVSGLQVNPAANGGMQFTASWVNPTLEFDGDPLADLDSVVVNVNGVHDTTFTNPAIGTPLSYIRNVTTAGFYQAVLTESHILCNWQNENELNKVTRAMFNGVAGNSINLSDKNEDVDVNFVLDPTWQIPNLELVFFVQDMETRAIFNGARQFVVGIEEPEQVHLSVYPNPATSSIRIDGIPGVPGSITMLNITDLTGRILTTRQVFSGTTQVDISNLKQGIYIITIENNQGKFATKLQVAH
jgi:hypothetical protein